MPSSPTKHKRTPCLFLLLLLLLAAATGARWRARQQNNEGALAGSGGCSAYLVVGAFWGLNNQRYSILRGAYAAHRLGCCLVAPPLYVDYGQRDLNWTLHPFDYFFDWGAFAAGAAALGFRAVRALPPAFVPNCTAQLQYLVTVEQMSIDLIQTWQARTGVACFSAINTILGLRAEGERHYSKGGMTDSYRLLQPYFHLLQPSPLFVALQDQAAARLRSNFNTTEFVAVQGRTERDWWLGCRDLFRFEMKALNVQCYVDDPAITAALLANFSVPPSTRVFVMSEMPKSGFQSLCQAYQCVDKEDLLDMSDAVVADLLNHTTTAAYVDYILASRAKGVYANILSSFGRALVAQANLSGAPVHYYNPPCDASKNVTLCTGIDPLCDPFNTTASCASARPITSAAN